MITSNYIGETLYIYNANAQFLYDSTVNIDTSEEAGNFLKYLKPGSSILDLGCGSGRDSKYFVDKGYKVTALDGSEKMAKLASEHIGQNVICDDALDHNFKERFDGIWTVGLCHHLNLNDTQTLIRKYYNILKDKGFMFLALLEGNFEGYVEDGRYYRKYSFDEIYQIIKKLPGAEIVEYLLSKDGTELESRWLRFIIRKTPEKFEICKNTLDSMDKNVENFKAGNVSEPIDWSDYALDDSEEIVTSNNPRPEWIVRYCLPLIDYNILLVFEDGSIKLFNAKKYLIDDAKIYEPLKDIKFFMKAHVECHTVVWNEMIDVAPEFLYDKGIPITAVSSPYLDKKYIIPHFPVKR